MGDVQLHEGRRRLLVGRVGLQAGLPGLHYLFGTGAPNAARAVAGQFQTSLLAQVLDPFPHRGRPLRVRLIFERGPACRQDLDQRNVSLLARRRPQSGVQRLFVGIEVHIQGDGRVGPDLARVGT